MTKNNFKKSSIPLGLHLMVDAYNCPNNILDDMKICYQFLDILPEQIGMKKLTIPYVIHADANDKKDPGGWTGFVIIAISYKRSYISQKRFCKHRCVLM